MNRVRKSIIFLFIILCFSMLFSVDEVMAISVSKGSYVNFSTYGLAPSGTTHSRTSHKKSDGKDAYCIQIKKNFTAGTYTSSNCNANGINNGLSSTHYIVAGQIIDIIDKKKWSDEKK